MEHLRQPCSRVCCHLAVGVGGNLRRARTNVPSILVTDMVKAPPDLPTGLFLIFFLFSEVKFNSNSNSKSDSFADGGKIKGNPKE